MIDLKTVRARLDQNSFDRVSLRLEKKIDTRLKVCKNLPVTIDCSEDTSNEVLEFIAKKYEDGGWDVSYSYHCLRFDHPQKKGAVETPVLMNPLSS